MTFAFCLVKWTSQLLSHKVPTDMSARLLSEGKMYPCLAAIGRLGGRLMVHWPCDLIVSPFATSTVMLLGDDCVFVLGVFGSTK